MTWISLRWHEFILLTKLTIGTELGVVHLECLGTGVIVDIIRVTCFRSFTRNDGHGTLRTDNVFHKECFFGHHRTPPCFVPAN